MLVDAFFSFISSAAIVKLLKEYQRPNTQFRTNGINLKKTVCLLVTLSRLNRCTDFNPWLR